MGGKTRVQLDGQHLGGAGGQRSGNGAAPGPISTTVRPDKSPSEAAMRSMACASLRKFWPSLGLAGMGFFDGR